MQRAAAVVRAAWRRPRPCLPPRLACPPAPRRQPRHLASCHHTALPCRSECAARSQGSAPVPQARPPLLPPPLPLLPLSLTLACLPPGLHARAKRPVPCAHHHLPLPRGAGWMGFNCLHPMKRYCTHKHRQFGFEVSRVEPDLAAGMQAQTFWDFPTSHCAGGSQAQRQAQRVGRGPWVGGKVRLGGCRGACWRQAGRQGAVLCCAVLPRCACLRFATALLPCSTTALACRTPPTPAPRDLR